MTSLATMAAGPVYGQTAAPASDRGVTIDWVAPPDCIDAATVEDEVSRLLGGHAVTSDKRLHARARVERTQDGAWRVALETEHAGMRGARVFSAASCAAAGDATALILALTIDPAHVAAAHPTPSAERAPGEPANEEPTAQSPRIPPRQGQEVRSGHEEVDRSTASGAATSTHWAMGAFGVADVGSMPVTAGGFGGSLGWTPGHARVEVIGVAYPGVTVEVGPARGGTFHLASGALRGCYAVVVRSAFEGSPCVGLEVGALRGDGFGVVSPGSGNATWVASSVGGLLMHRVMGAFALRLNIDLVVAMTRPQFVLDVVGFVHRPSPLGGRVALGMEVRF